MNMDEEIKRIFINYKVIRARRILKWKQTQNKRRSLLINEWKSKVNKYVELLQTLLSIYKPRHRSIGYYYRDDQVGINLLQRLNEQCGEEFSISHQQFIWLCERLRSDLKTKPNPISQKQKKVSVEEKVAITLFKLKSCCEYQIVGNTFGYSKSTIHKIFYEVIKAIVKRLSKDIITFPKSNECKDISDKFEDLCDIPQIMGAIGATHIPVTVYNKGKKDFINSEGWTSIVLQAVVDDKCMFRDISCIFPGSIHDATVLKGSQIYKDAAKTFPVSDYHINEVKIPYFLLGNPTYPLLPWILKDYCGAELKAKKAIFNDKLNSGRVKIEQAFEILKSCWLILSRRSEIDVNFMPQVVAACCILHNIFLKNSEPYCFSAEGSADTPAEDFLNMNGRLIRDTLTDMLYTKIDYYNKI